MLILKRDHFTTHNITSQLFIDDKPFLLDGKELFFLEDEARPDGVKIAKQTAIPAGDYFITINYSQRFGRLMPLIYNHIDSANGMIVVSGKVSWTGIRQHSGNTEEDTEGCQLAGFIRTENSVNDSRNAFKAYFDWLTDELKKYPTTKAIPYKIINDQKL